jgi:hypothetical protein
VNELYEFEGHSESGNQRLCVRRSLPTTPSCNTVRMVAGRGELITLTCTDAEAAGRAPLSGGSRSLVEQRGRET